MNTIRFASKEAFIEALEGRRVFWREYDKRREQEHKAAEKQWLTDARAKLRDALKMDYATLTTEDKGGYRRSAVYLGDLPRCPALMEAKLDKVIAPLRLSQGKTFNVDSRGVWSEAHNLLTWDPDAKTSVC